MSCVSKDCKHLTAMSQNKMGKTSVHLITLIRGKLYVEDCGNPREMKVGIFFFLSEFSSSG